MANNTVISSIINQLQDTGSLAMNALYPNDFEYYMFALELVDGSDETIDYFTFPIMPSSISVTEEHRVSVKQSQSSIFVYKNSSFTPYTMQVRGSFGRSFKMLTNRGGGTGSAISGTKKWWEISSNTNSPNEFPIKFVKSGYGCIKILQSIIDKSKGFDSKGSYKLYVYNLGLGESYLAVPATQPISFSQDDKESNMIWNYDLKLTILAPLEAIRDVDKKVFSLKNSLSKSYIQSSVNRVSKTAYRSIL